MTITIDDHGKKLDVRITDSKVEGRYEGDKHWTKISDPEVIAHIEELKAGKQ